MWLLDSLIGSFVIQTFVHSLIAALIIERAIVIWNIKSHLTKFRYRAMTLMLPVVLYPVFILINPERYSFAFRHERVLLNLNNWLSVDLWELVPVHYLFLLIFAVTSAVFLFQEIVPILRDALSREDDDDGHSPGPDDETAILVSTISRDLNIRPPQLKILRSEDPIIFTSGSRTHLLVVSSGLIETLNPEQLTSAITHELAHIKRQSNATTWAIFMLRIFMFFNPVSLLVFRRIVQDDEHVCDDITVSFTKNPPVLASALRAFYTAHEGVAPHPGGRLSRMREELESHSHNLLLKERIERLEQISHVAEERFELDKFALTAVSIICINYFVV